MTLANAKAAHDTAQSRVDALQAHQVAIRKTLGEIAEEVRQGNIRRASEAATLVTERAGIEIELETAIDELQTAATALGHATRKDNTGRFEVAIAEAQQANAEYVQFFRQACLALGRQWSAYAEATVLANSTASALGIDPIQKTMLSLSTLPNPLSNWQDATPDTTQGWMKIPPLAAYRER